MLEQYCSIMRQFFDTILPFLSLRKITTLQDNKCVPCARVFTILWYGIGTYFFLMSTKCERCMIFWRFLAILRHNMTNCLVQYFLKMLTNWKNPLRFSILYSSTRLVFRLFATTYLIINLLFLHHDIENQTFST